jgi:hypothetical protein
MPEKHLARQGVFGLLCGEETVLGVVLATPIGSGNRAA